MSKTEEFEILAEKYYVEDQFSITQISEKLNINIKTIGDWKKKGRWEEKRKKFLASQYSCYSALQELLMYLSKDALEKIKSGEVPESASLNFIAKMAEKLPKIKILNEEKREKNTDIDVQTKIAELVDKKLCE